MDNCAMNHQEFRQKQKAKPLFGDVAATTTQ